ncbi:WW domain-binding protein 11 [Ixodes scapularis]
MGRRSINTTKSGKYMNPTDQARKEARKRELKKNKKQRQMVRAAVLKGKDPQQLVLDLQRIDEMEYNVQNPPPLSEKVLRDKRKKLRETWDRVLRLYQKEDPEHFSELKKMELEYEDKRNTLIKYYESVKFAQSVEIDQIPLPSAPSAPHVAPSLIPLPMDIPASILKKPVMDPTMKAPGVPPGPPPELSDDEEMEENEPPSNKVEKPAEDKAEKTGASKPRKIRFADEGPDRPPGVDDDADVTEFLKEVEKSHREAVPPPMPMVFRHPPPNMPPPPSMPPPSLPPMAPPSLRIALPPGPPPGLPPRPPSRPLPPRPQAPPVLSAPPSLIPRPAPGEEPQQRATTIEAKPQLRNLSADVTRFTPTSLRVKRDLARKAPRDVPMMPAVQVVPAPTKDDAYELFMKEMENLL